MAVQNSGFGWAIAAYVYKHTLYLSSGLDSSSLNLTRQRSADENAAAGRLALIA